MIKIVCSLLVCAVAFAAAQTDSTTATVDTLGAPSPGVEALLEESAELDGSSILDFLRESRPGSTQPIHIRSGTQMSQRLQPSEGYANGTYQGSRTKIRQRISVEAATLSGGALLAKDAGESTANAFVSGYLSYRGDGVLRRMSVGDYRIESGQGISMWRGRDFSKGADILAPALRRGRGVVPSLSSDEATYLRGAALEVSFKAIDAVIFISSRRFGATVDTDRTVRSLYASGYYRTESEVRKRGALGEKLYGARISSGFSVRNQFGMTFYRADYSFPLSLGGGARFEGSGYSLAAIDYMGYFGGISAFAEGAVAGKTFGGVAGLALVPSGGFSFAAVLRAYPSSFYSAHGSGFGDGVDNSNEYGMYIGAQNVVGRFVFSGYIDHTLIPLLQLRHFASAGNEIFGRVQVQVSERSTAELQYHRSSKEPQVRPEDESNEAGLDGRSLIQRVRVQGAYLLAPGSELRIRCESSFLNDPSLPAPEKGLLVYGDLASRFGSFVWANLRLVLFATDSYATRIAEYERDLNGVASIPSMYGSGARWYLLVRLKPLTRIQVNLKYSDVVRDDVRTIGTGPEALTTNHDNRLSAELELRF